MGQKWEARTAEEIWNEVRSLAPDLHGMTYRKLEERGGIQWPFPDEDGPETSFLHARLWETDPEKRGRPAPFGIVEHALPVDKLDEEFNLRLTTGRRLTDYNTGVQSSGFNSPLRIGTTIDMSPEDLAKWDFEDGEIVRISSRRGSVLAPARLEPALRPGLVFMVCNFPDEVDTNALTIEANDPISGTAEFKATAVKVEKLVDVEVETLDEASELVPAGQEV
jgi:predicted molibdopterin-dependent oxidoreductase YjgC